MRRRIGTALVAAIIAGACAYGAAAQQPALSPTQRIGTMSELMVHLIYPTSDAVFYISSRTPATEAEWSELQARTLILAESANLLMMPGRVRPGQWVEDARAMLDAGRAAFAAAKAKDVAAVEAVSDQLYESCVSCHKAYRPDYGKPKPPRQTPGR